MNGKTRRIRQITIETRSVTIIRARGANLHDAFCANCRQQVCAFSLIQTAAFLQTSVGEICRFIETGEFHSIGTNEIPLLVCGNSLAAKRK